MAKLSDFDLDFRFGQLGEDAVANILSIETVEVKTDRRWKQTGNIYIETEFYSTSKEAWVPSGINITKATHWAFKLEDMLIIIETPTLKGAIEKYGKQSCTSIQPNPSNGYLIKPEQLLQYIKEIKNG